MQQAHWGEKTLVQQPPFEAAQQPPPPAAEKIAAMPPAAEQPQPRSFESLYAEVFQQKMQAEQAVGAAQRSLAEAGAEVQRADEEYKDLPLAVASSEPARLRLLDVTKNRALIAGKLNGKFNELQELQMEFQPYEALVTAMSETQGATESIQNLQAEQRAIQAEGQQLAEQWGRLIGPETQAQVQELQAQQAEYLAQQATLQAELSALKNSPERMLYEPFRPFVDHPVYAKDYIHVKSSLMQSDEAIATKQIELKIVQQLAGEAAKGLQEIDTARAGVVARHGELTNRHDAIAQQFIPAEEARLKAAQALYEANLGKVQDSATRRVSPASSQAPAQSWN